MLTYWMGLHPIKILQFVINKNHVNTIKHKQRTLRNLKKKLNSKIILNKYNSELFIIKTFERTNRSPSTHSFANGDSFFRERLFNNKCPIWQFWHKTYMEIWHSKKFLNSVFEFSCKSKVLKYLTKTNAF